MGLEEYRRKRDFRRTAEPRGETHPSGATLSYVIQKHAASHLHYDFRLELDGVLKSWAVPKGPSLDPEVKRLAVHVEDHPLEYGGFEGVIPRGEYGGGTVMLWDRGVWEPRDDPQQGYRKGHLKFTLHGEKLHGGWHLVRSRRGDDSGKEQWLLFKEADEAALPERRGKITERETRSVASGRELDEIAAQADATWHSNRAVAAGSGFKASLQRAAGKARARVAGKRAAATAAEGDAPVEQLLPGAKRGAMPRELLPELATLVDEVPAGDEWLHEIKFDGYRLLLFKQGSRVRALTRKGNDWTGRFPTLVEAVARLPAEQAVLDGEVVIVAPDGTTSFQQLQNVLNNGRHQQLVFYAFDLPYLAGMDLRGVPLLQRKAALQGLLAAAPEGPLRYSDHVTGNGAVFHQQACRMGLEGIIAKRADSRYLGRRTRDWLKIKCQKRQEFVIGGWTDPKGSRTAFGSLLLGFYRGDQLVHAGRVGTGFDEARLRDLHRRLKRLESESSPFSDYGARRRPAGVHWARPELVGEVTFTEWTEEGILRHPVFQGLREDKDAREVVREDDPAPPSPAAEASPEAEEEYVRPLRNRDLLERAPAPRRKSGGRRTPEAEVAGVRLTNPAKVLYPDTGVTKLDLARFYEQIGEQWMLPYCAGRPLTLVRCPEGAGKPCFYQKHADENFPAAVGRVDVTENSGEQDIYTYVDSVAGLVSMVQMGVLELHVWGARRDNPERPDLFILDLDPADDVPWARVVSSAFSLREQLGELGLESWCKTTGGKGLHLVVPLARRHEWDEVKEFTRLFCKLVSARAPGQYITKSTLAARRGKIFLDYLRNARGATAISAYSVRAKRVCPVSVPIGWDELTPKLRPDEFTPMTVLKRLAKLKRDPWEQYYSTSQTITRAMKKVVGMD